MASFYSFLSLFGRVLIGGVFLAGALWRVIPNFSAVAGTLRDNGVPWPGLVLGVLVVLALAGSTSVILGYWTRLGAAALMVALFIATVHFHDFWNAWTRSGFAEDFTDFLELLALFGALLLLAGRGPGPISVDGGPEG